MTKKKLVRFFYDESLEHNLNEEKILDENNETYWVYNYIYINNIKKELKKLSIKFISDQNGIRIEYDQENFLKIEFDLCMYVEELSSFFLEKFIGFEKTVSNLLKEINTTYGNNYTLNYNQETDNKNPFVINYGSDKDFTIEEKFTLLIYSLNKIYNHNKNLTDCCNESNYKIFDSIFTYYIDTDKNFSKNSTGKKYSKSSLNIQKTEENIDKSNCSGKTSIFRKIYDYFFQ
ncbi:hypothetical protein GVAV_000709 [Gurleya vavrai]